MAIFQGKSKRSPSGGRNVVHRGKKKFELGRDPTETRLGEKNLRKIRTRGGNEKLRLALGNEINLINPSDNKAQKLEILNVVENDANPNYVRRNIITKGAVVETELGKAKITSRPGQNGIINGVLFSEN
ncbi:MAG: 30S ribosomal protein S8e [Methanobrevibacter sp.]|jgi:small subunit ribosomal protein S8e|nr:30S ribosomal protein S8e [Candidatus Methanovirga basalitermitum]